MKTHWLLPGALAVGALYWARKRRHRPDARERVMDAGRRVSQAAMLRTEPLRRRMGAVASEVRTRGRWSAKNLQERIRTRLHALSMTPA